MQELLSNDPRSKNQQVWTLALKKKKKGAAPKFRACGRTQNEDELTVNVTGLYVPYEQNFVTETMLYFCPKQQCIKSIPYWSIGPVSIYPCQATLHTYIYTLLSPRSPNGAFQEQLF